MTTADAKTPSQGRPCARGLPTSTWGTWRDILIGRQTELDQLGNVLESLASGSGRVVMLVGEAGIGKTRVLTRFLEQAHSAGALTLRGACHEAGWAIPYGPFASALGDYVQVADLEQLRVDLGYGLAPLAHLLPVLRDRFGRLPLPAPLAPGEEQLRLFEAVGSFISKTTARQPVVLTIDDLHWADRDTLALLRHVMHFVTAHRLLIVGTYREEDLATAGGLGELLPVLRSETVLEQLHLAGLQHRHVEQLMRHIFSTAIASWAPPSVPGPAILDKALVDTDAELTATIGCAPLETHAVLAGPAWKTAVDRVHGDSGGNPLFVWEMSLDLLERAAGDPVEALRLASRAPLAVPRGVRDVVERRLRTLAPSTAVLVTIGAACHGPFRFDLAASVAGLDDDAALNALDQALGTRLLCGTTGYERYDFTHALIRRGIIGRLSESRQVRLHRRIAQALERLPGDPDGQHLADIAHHYHRSASLPGAEAGVAPALAMAEQAEARSAVGQVAEFLEIALDLLPAADPRRLSVMARLGLALASTLAFERAMPLIEAASTQMAAHDREAATGYLADAARVLTIAGDQRGGWRCAGMGLALGSSSRDRAWVWLKALDITRRRAEDPDDLGLLTETPDVRELCDVAPRVPLALWEQLFLTNYVAPHTRDEAIRNKLHDVASLPCYDDQRVAVDLLCEGAAKSEREGRIGVMVYYLAALARALTAGGDLGGAGAVLTRARTVGARMPHPSISMLVVLAAENDLHLALDEGLEALLEGHEAQALSWAKESRWAMAAVRAATARTCASVGRHDAALALLEMVPTALELAPPWITIYTKTACDAAAALWLVGRTDHAARIETCLRDKVLPGDLRDYLREVRLSIAQLCALQGRVDEAQHWFAEARRTLDRRGARTLRAIADYDEALMFARRAAPGDRERASALGDAATRQFEALGMTGWVRRAAALLQRPQGWESPGSIAACVPLAVGEPTRPGQALFRREGDVWRIAFAGREVRLRDARGLRYLACLLSSPRREIHATDLVRLATQTPGPVRAGHLSGSEIRVRADLGDAGADIDERAAHEYRERLAELQEELQEAEGNSDLGGIQRARHEMSLLTEQLARGHGHAVASHAERARVAVTKGIGSALARINAAHPVLGAHLTASVHRGYFCSYRPDALVPIVWQT